MDIGRNKLLEAQQANNSPYYREFVSTLDDFEARLGSSLAAHIREHKLFLSSAVFDAETYAQGAAETTVVRYFLRRYPDTFVYEPKLNRPSSNKNVECSVGISGLRLNVEVKVARHDKKIVDDQYPGIKIESYGHFESFPELAKELLPLFGGGPRQPDPKIAVRLENNLYDHLKLANEKFNVENPRTHCNILCIGCGSSDDAQACYGYLTSVNGFFTKESYKPKETYDRVDLVFLTNLYFKHSEYYSGLDEKSWQLENCFLVGVPNPYAQKTKYETITKVLEIVPSMTKEFNAFCESSGNRLLEILKLKIFIHGELGERHHLNYFG